MFRRNPCLAQYSAVTILNFSSFEQGTLHFHFTPGFKMRPVLFITLPSLWMPYNLSSLSNWPKRGGGESLPCSFSMLSFRKPSSIKEKRTTELSKANSLPRRGCLGSPEKSYNREYWNSQIWVSCNVLESIHDQIQ